MLIICTDFLTEKAQAPWLPNIYNLELAVLSVNKNLHIYFIADDMHPTCKCF